MNIAGTQYSLQNKALEIYVSGCDGSCKGCHNPELWNFNIGNPYKSVLPKIINKINEFSTLIDNIWILGGEPLQQNWDELYDLLWSLQITKKKIWLFTRENIDNVPTFIKKRCNYIKCGRYIESLRSDGNIQFGVKLASSNQNIIKLEGIDKMYGK
jgi:anaerobic ribonucleoside-triphosphate reductase activating protein